MTRGGVVRREGGASAGNERYREHDRARKTKLDHGHSPSGDVVSGSRLVPLPMPNTLEAGASSPRAASPRASPRPQLITSREPPRHAAIAAPLCAALISRVPKARCKTKLIGRYFC